MHRVRMRENEQHTALEASVRCLRLQCCCRPSQMSEVCRQVMVSTQSVGDILTVDIPREAQA